MGGVLRKTIGIIGITILVANMIGYVVLRYDMLTFWIILLVTGGISWSVLKLLK